jgi:glycosyltransferase involved in cell wall biosynthesis
VAGAANAPLRVLHTMQTWLPLSEQFVHTTVSMSRHRGVVVARHRLEHRDVFPYEPVYSLHSLIPPRMANTRVERRVVTGALLAVALGHRVDLVHHHHGYRLLDPLGLVTRRKLPYVVSLHGHDVTAFADEWPGTLERAADAVDAVIVPSRFLVPFAERRGFPRERIHVLPSGVDTSWFTPTPVPAEPTVLFVGRFVEKKGLDTLLAAWPKVHAAIPEAALHVLGLGPLETLARSGGPGVTVELTDASRRRAQVRDAIRSARVVVTPSRTAADGDVDTLLLVNLEAQASGRAVVTTRHGGIPEFVDEGSTALLVEENDPAALADGLITALGEAGLAERLGAAGAVWAKQFDAHVCTARLDDLYTTLAS